MRKKTIRNFFSFFSIALFLTSFSCSIYNYRYDLRCLRYPVSCNPISTS